MIKIIFQDSQDELVKAAGSLSCLFEGDRHIKSAASDAFSADLMRKHVPKDDKHFGVHLIAMGSQEKYGYNRNGDGWPEDGLKARHNTFVSHGHLFREHKNTDPKFKVGDVKASAYNDKMGRVELIVWGDKDKAPDMYEKAASGKPLSFSMSAKVPYDVCSICANKAKGSSKYCSHLKESMCQYLPKFKKFAFAENPTPTFFDISEVKNPADRIAHFIEYQMTKAASATAFQYSDILAQAEGVSIPDTNVGCVDLLKQAMLTRLAETEQYVRAAINGEDIGTDAKAAFFKEAVTRAFEPQDITEVEMSIIRATEPGYLFAGLAKRATVLPFEAFVSYVTGNSIDQVYADPMVKQAKGLLPTVFQQMLNSESDPVLEDLFEPDFSKFSSGDPVDKVMDQVADRHSVNPQVAKTRIMKITVQRGSDLPMPVKSASMFDAVEEARKLSRAYGFYKVSFCVAAEQVLNETFVDEPVRLLVSYQHVI